MVRRCCCCVPVLVGATLLGVVGVLAALAELAVIVPYLSDFEDFNPIKDGEDQVFYVFENMLADQNFTREKVQEIVTTAREYLWTALLAEAVSTGVYALVAALMVAGVHCKKRALMLPYLIVQMIVIITLVLVAIGLTIGLFFSNYIMGSICLGVGIVICFLFIYFWVAVQKAYKELGNRDYMYSPAPIKPIYNPPEHKYHHHNSHPRAPQKFNME